MKDWLKRILPGWVQYLIYRFLWDPIRMGVWRSLGLECTLRSGLIVRVLSHPDWVIYNEVIVNGEYDIVIREMLETTSGDRPLRVVDLGANVGYFSFRVADLFVQEFGEAGDLQLTLVEGSPAVFADLERRVREQPFLRNKTRLINGLVGKKEGSAYISQGYIHYGHGASDNRTWGARLVPYVDLSNLLAGMNGIDLLKCDVEGAEFDLIDNYPVLLQKVRAAVFEFHHYGRDVDRARQQLRTFGFKSPEVLHVSAPCSVEFFRH